MHKIAALDAEDFVTVSPAVAQIVETLLSAHPSLSTVPAVSVAILGVTFQYIRHLRGATAPLAVLGDADTRRALLFLMNTQQPLPGDPTMTAADLFVAAKAELMSNRNRPRALSSVRAFEHAIASIAHAARVVRNRSCVPRSVSRLSLG